MKTGLPFPKDRLEDQTARLLSLDILQELVCAIVVDDQDVVAAEEVVPAVAELMRRYGVVEVRGRKPHVIKGGLGEWLLLL